MLIVGVTGGIGSGKTVLTDWLKTQDISIIDADLVARAVVEPGKPALKEIADIFGQEFVGDDGSLNRKAMREIVFSDKNSRLTLEKITHPRIEEEVWDQLKKAHGPYLILSSPLLFESRQAEIVDLSVVVDVPEELQISRATARDKDPVELVQSIIDAQLDRASRLARADFVIDNTGTFDQLYVQAKTLHAELLARAQID